MHSSSGSTITFDLAARRKPCKTGDGEIYYFNFATGDRCARHGQATRRRRRARSARRLSSCVRLRASFGWDGNTAAYGTIRVTSSTRNCMWKRRRKSRPNKHRSKPRCAEETSHLSRKRTRRGAFEFINVCLYSQLPVLTSLQTWLGDCRTKRSRRARPAKPPEERTSPSQAPAARRPSRRLGRLVRVAAVARVCTESVRCACLVGRHCTTQDARVWQHAAPRTAHGADNTDDVRVCCRAAPERVGSVGVAANSMR